MNEYINEEYISSPRRVIHWSTALSVALVFTAIIIRDSVESKWGRGLLLSMHELIGALVLILTIIRIFLIATGKRSVITRGLIPRFGHTTIYLLLLYQPLIGLLTAQAKGGKALTIFHIQIPQILPADEDFADALFQAHELIGWIFLGIIVGHIAMAMWHVYFQKDPHA